MWYTFRQLIPYTMLLHVVFLLHISAVQAQIRIVDDGTPTLDDLLQAQHLASQCLGMNLSVDDNQASLSGNRMGVAFQPHESGSDLQRFFVGRFLRPEPSEVWQTQVITLHAAQTLDDGHGVHVTGLLEPATTEQLYQVVTDLWTTALGPDFTITAISTSRNPEIFCDYTTPLSVVEGVWYEVLVAAEKLPDTPILPRYLYASGIVSSGGRERARAGDIKFTFRENASGNPEFVSVDCATVPDFCGPTLDTLETALGTNGDEDTTQRDAAIMAVLPPAYTKDDISEMQVTTGNGREALVVQLEDVPASAARTVRGIVICRRPLASAADWECEYRFINYNQVLAIGMTVSVRSLDVSDAQVETMVESVAGDIINARMVTISPRDSGYMLNAAGPGMTGLTAYFGADLALTGKEYRGQ